MQKPDLTYLASLKVEDGVIRTRGMYYAERRYVPHFHSRCDGGHYNYYQRDPDDNLWHVCQVTDAEREAALLEVIGERLNRGLFGHRGLRRVGW